MTMFFLCRISMNEEEEIEGEIVGAVSVEELERVSAAESHKGQVRRKRSFIQSYR